MIVSSSVRNLCKEKHFKKKKKSKSSTIIRDEASHPRPPFTTYPPLISSCLTHFCCILIVVIFFPPPLILPKRSIPQNMAAPYAPNTTPMLHSDLWNYILTFIPSHQGVALRFIKYFSQLPVARAWRAAPAKEAVADAASRGSVALVEFLHGTLRFPLSPAACAGAARGGHLALLQWLRAKRCAWDAQTSFEAARNAHVHVLEYTAGQQLWSTKTCAAAAESGHFDTLKWLRAHDCPWDQAVTSRAAARGDLAMLQWSRAQGCPWTEMTCNCAAQNGHLQVLKWFVRRNEGGETSHPPSDIMQGS